MVRLDTNTARLLVGHDSAPTVAEVNNAVVTFKGQIIKATGEVDLIGAPGESIAGWKFGFAQLEYVEDNFAHYRGRTNREGSIRLSLSHRIVARDTSDKFPSIFLDSPSIGLRKGRGTFVAPAGMTLPASGRRLMSTHMADRPEDGFDCSLTNPAAHNATNFLYHAYTTFMFYTAFIAQEPGGQFHILKHFYWNIRWHIRAEPSGANSIRITNRDSMALTVGAVHSGNANDQRFASKVLRPGLPVANDLARRPPHRENLPVWG